MYTTVFWTLCKRVRVGWYGKMALKHVNYHMWNESPVQVRCMIQGTRGWCTGMTQRDGIDREVGGGFRMGNTCTPMADSCKCMAKPIQYFKVKKKLILKEIFKKKYSDIFTWMKTLMGLSQAFVYMQNSERAILTTLPCFCCFCGEVGLRKPLLCHSEVDIPLLQCFGDSFRFY